MKNYAIYELLRQNDRLHQVKNIKREVSAVSELNLLKVLYEDFDFKQTTPL